MGHFQALKLTQHHKNNEGIPVDEKEVDIVQQTKDDKEEDRDEDEEVYIQTS